MADQYDDFHPVYRRSLHAARWGFEAGFLLGVEFANMLTPEELQTLQSADTKEAERYLIEACEAALVRWSRDVGHAFDTTSTLMPEEDED